jgi:broad specificity phosphatase PhoE
MMPAAPSTRQGRPYPAPVSARTTLITSAPTSATSAAAFPPVDEPLDRRGATWAADARGRITGDRAVCSPALAGRQTAAALGLAVTIEPRIGDWDLGRWRGHTLDEIAATEPEAVQAWLTDPDAVPHGGESLSGLLARVEQWLDALPADGHTVVITHPAVVRAAVVGTVAAAAPGFWRIDIAPLTATVLRGRPGRWTLRSTGRPLVGAPAAE